jgi:hypothetical protein
MVAGDWESTISYNGPRKNWHVGTKEKAKQTTHRVSIPQTFD